MTGQVTKEDLRSEHDRLLRNQRLSGTVRLVLGVIVAVAVAVILSSYIQRDNQIAGCKRNAEAKIIEAHFYKSVGADYYMRQIRTTIAMPHGWKGDLAVRGDNKTDRIIGCEDAFPPLIPGVQ